MQLICLSLADSRPEAIPLPIAFPEFPPLPDSQREFLTRRTAVAHERSAVYPQLRAHLLELGGLEVVPPRFDIFEGWEVRREEYYIRRVLECGRTWPGDDVLREVATTNECHTNVARLYMGGRGQIATGWALADDGLWRGHSWLVEGTSETLGRVVETTVSWLAYHGAVLSVDEAARFTRDELGDEGIPKGAT